MENHIRVFTHEEFGQIRIINIDGQSWFVGKDVAEKLGYAETNSMVKRLDSEDFISAKMEGMNMKSVLINESGLYTAIIGSKLPAAKAFKRWVTSEVLPSIRKNGGYITENALDQLIDNPEAAMKFFNTLKEERIKKDELDEYVKVLEPKAQYHDIILQCPDLIPVTIIAKEYGKSAISFNRMLYDFNFQFNQSGTWVLYQKYADKGYTDTKTYHVNENHSVIHTYFTQKGRNFLYHFLKSKNVLPMAERRAITTAENEQMTLNE